MGSRRQPPLGVLPRNRPDDEPVPLVGPTPEFEEGLVSSEELRVLLGQDEDPDQE